MQLLFFIILIYRLNVCQALVQCNGTVTKVQLCSVEAEYDLGSTGSEKLGSPLTLKSKLNVLDAADFDENESTITLNLLFTILWTDVRLRLESNKPNE